MICKLCNVEMEKLTIEGSRGLRLDNLRRWENDGTEAEQLPNSEWFDGSYSRIDFQCPECFYRIHSDEAKINLVGDE